LDSISFLTKVHRLEGRLNTVHGSFKDDLKDVINEIKRRHIESSECAALLKSDLGSLRLHVKYIIFDLEATRRENSYLRKLLKDN
jgi:hypothetical protein